MLFTYIHMYRKIKDFLKKGLYDLKIINKTITYIHINKIIKREKLNITHVYTFFILYFLKNKCPIL